MARNYPKSRPTPFHTGFCRFTDRRVEVFEHGHGIKLSIRTSDAEGDVVSVFLDAGDLADLSEALDGVTGNIGKVSQAMLNRSQQLERVLSDLSSVLHRNGF